MVDPAVSPGTGMHVGKVSNVLRHVSKDTQ